MSEGENMTNTRWTQTGNGNAYRWADQTRRFSNLVQKGGLYVVSMENRTTGEVSQFIVNAKHNRFIGLDLCNTLLSSYGPNANVYYDLDVISVVQAA